MVLAHANVDDKDIRYISTAQHHAMIISVVFRSQPLDDTNQRSLKYR
jgi:hypothetical protein